MTRWPETLILWLADYYLLATLLLTAAFACLAVLRQPARRLAVGWAVLGSLALLAVLVTVPGWPRLPLRPLTSPPESAKATPRLPPARSLTETAGRAFNSTSAGMEPQVYNLVLTEAEVRQLLQAGGRSTSLPAKPLRPETTTAGKGQMCPTAPRKARPAAAAAAPAAGEAVDWPATLTCVFLGGGLAALGWISLGLLQVRRLCREGVAAPEPLQALLRRVVGERRRLPRLLLGTRLNAPVALGTLRPTILLPAQAATVPEAHLEAVLAHEWAHIRRGDLWLLALARGLLPVLFAHPLYWWLRGRLRQDQEAVADAAAAGTGGAIDYAAALLHWVQLGKKRRGAEPALALWAKPSELKRRITMLLDPNFAVEPHCPRRWRWGAWSLAGVAVLALSVLTLRPLPPAAAEPPAVKPAVKPPLPVQKPPAQPRKVRALKRIAPPVAPAPKVRAVAPEKLRGRVRADKKAVAGAEVVLVVWDPSADPAKAPAILARARSDAKGRYELPVPAKVPAERLLTLVSAKGFGLGWNFFPQGAPDPVIELRPEQVMRGRLIDLQGQPASGVKVQVSRLGDPAAAHSMMYGFYTNDVAFPIAKQPGAVFADFGGNGRLMGGMMPIQGSPGSALYFREPPARFPFWPGSVTTDAQGRFTVHGVARNTAVGLQIRDDRFALQALNLPARDKDKADETTLILAQARVIEGVVTDARTGKPLADVQMRVPAMRDGYDRFVVFARFASGDVDWKGRRLNGGLSERFFVTNYMLHGAGLAFSDLEVKTDRHGRYRLPLFVAGSYRLQVSAPTGAPYFAVSRTVTWPRAAARQEVNIALERGVWVNGKVTETPAGKPVGGARVDFWSPGLKLPEGVRPPQPLTTGADGTFRTLLPAAPWHLLVNAAAPEYVLQRVEAGKLSGTQALRVGAALGQIVTLDPAAKKPQYLYPDGVAAVALQYGAAPQEVAVKLRRVTLSGKLVGADGQLVKKAVMLYRRPAPDYEAATKPADAKTARRLYLDVLGRMPPPAILQSTAAPVEIRDGRFALPVQDLDARYQLIFLDASRSMGAVAEVMPREAVAKPPTVQMTACGSARARFVDEKGKPLAKYRPSLWMLLPPGPHANQPANWYGAAFGLAPPSAPRLAFVPNGTALFADLDVEVAHRPLPYGAAPDRVWAGLADPLHYGKGPEADAKGNVTLPALVAGLTYRLVYPGGPVKDFQVEANKVLDLRTITVKQPPQPQPKPIQRLLRPVPPAKPRPPEKPKAVAPPPVIPLPLAVPKPLPAPPKS